MTKLRVIACSAQNGRAIYPCRENSSAPEVASWRNNLTAFSHYQNLLFIAYLEQIHVFKPQFPNQALDGKPDLIINLPKSRPGLRGYLNVNSGHSINHLIVGDLGSEEIVAVGCDDGDVISYRIHSVNLAIEQARPLGEPWLLENVGASAWGLAIHKEARLLAVSSNTRNIDVFAPALRKPVSLADTINDDVGLSFEDDKASPIRTTPAYWLRVPKSMPDDRHVNVRICLTAHNNNIPNIAFCNTLLDREGRYLASTDIGNNTFIWDIYRGTIVFRHRGDPSQHQRGWGVACLDPRTSRLTDNPVATFGCERHANDKSRVIDISKGARSVRDNSHWHPAFSAFGAVPGVNPVDTLATMDFTFNDGPSTEDELMSSDDESDVAVENEEMEQAVEYSESMDQEGGLEASGVIINDNALHHEIIFSPGHPPPGPSFTSDNLEEELPTAMDAMSDISSSTIVGILGSTDSTETPPSSKSRYLQRFLIPPEDIKRLADRVPPDKESPVVRLPFNLLQTSELDIQLFYGIQYDAGESSQSKDAPPIRVICEQALHQKLPPGLHHLGHIERLNMTAQIPELGVILIGNQAGRVGVLRATRWETLKQPGFKIECVLPFKSQEEQGLRPKKPLMGVAVGPIQGQENIPEPGSAQHISQEGKLEPRTALTSSRRFRLLLVYNDHSVLSYEISHSADSDVLIL